MCSSYMYIGSLLLTAGSLEANSRKESCCIERGFFDGIHLFILMFVFKSHWVIAANFVGS